MLTGLYSAGTAMQAALRQHELIAQNLAHAQMPGYRRVSLRHAALDNSFDEELRSAMLGQSMGTDSSVTMIDFSQGTVEPTDHPLDLALQGDGFFVVKTDQGLRYTRNGSFQLDENGRLVTADRLPVQGTGGDLTFPGEASYSSIQVLSDGTITADGNDVGQLQIVRFQNPQLLIPAGVTLFEAPPHAAPETSEATVLQGMRERSNVSPVQELVDLINVQRRHEAAQKAMTMLSESVQKNISRQGEI